MCFVHRCTHSNRCTDEQKIFKKKKRKTSGEKRKTSGPMGGTAHGTAMPCPWALVGPAPCKIVLAVPTAKPQKIVPCSTSTSIVNNSLDWISGEIYHIWLFASVGDLGFQLSTSTHQIGSHYCNELSSHFRLFSLLSISIRKKLFTRSVSAMNSG